MLSIDIAMVKSLSGVSQQNNPFLLTGRRRITLNCQVIEWLVSQWTILSLFMGNRPTAKNGQVNVWRVSQENNPFLFTGAPQTDNLKLSGLFTKGLSVSSLVADTRLKIGKC